MRGSKKKAPRHWPLCGKSAVHSTKLQWRGKCFHLMTSSCRFDVDSAKFHYCDISSNVGQIKYSNRQLRKFALTYSSCSFVRQMSSSMKKVWQIWNSINDGVLNTLRQRQNGRHYTEESFSCLFLYENVWISIKTLNVTLNFVPTGPIYNIPAYGQIMAWCRPGDNPLSEPLMVRLPTHTCVTRPQWVDKNTGCPDQIFAVLRQQMA